MVSVSFFQYRHVVQLSLFNLSVKLFAVPSWGLQGCSVGCKGPAAIRLLGDMYPAAANAGSNRTVSFACIACAQQISSNSQAVVCLDHIFIVLSMAPLS